MDCFGFRFPVRGFSVDSLDVTRTDRFSRKNKRVQLRGMRRKKRVIMRFWGCGGKFQYCTEKATFMADSMRYRELCGGVGVRNDATTGRS